MKRYGILAGIFLFLGLVGAYHPAAPWPDKTGAGAGFFCVTIQNLAAADDDIPIWTNPGIGPRTVYSASCICVGVCTDDAVISFDNDDADGAAAITGSVTCKAPNDTPALGTLSGAEATIDQFETMLMDTDAPAPNPETDDFTICVNYR